MFKSMLPCAGAGELWELRPTDIDAAKCRRRYEVFKEKSLKHPCSLSSGCLHARLDICRWVPLLSRGPASKHTRGGRGRAQGSATSMPNGKQAERPPACPSYNAVRDKWAPSHGWVHRPALRKPSKVLPCPCPAQAHYSTLLRLKQYFPFSLIDAMGSLDECRAQIARELRYQSSLDLDEATCASWRKPLAGRT